MDKDNLLAHGEKKKDFHQSQQRRKKKDKAERINR